MKKILLLLIILLSVKSAIAAQTLLPRDQIVVTLINQEPDPVAPGNIVDVRFRIENYGVDPAKNVDIKLMLKYPFSIYWNEDRIKNIGTLGARQKGDIGVREKFRLLVDSNAATGNNTLEFWYRVDNGIWTKAGEFEIEVRTREALVHINEIVSTPERMLPGSTANVKFFIDNNADVTIRDVKLKLDLLEKLETTSSITFREMPFTPIGSGNEKNIRTIDSKTTRSISFNLFTDGDAESKVYKVPYTLTYSDDAGKEFTIEGIVGLIVDSEPDLSVNIDETDILTSGTKGTVSIKFVNKGFSDIKFLDVILHEADDYDILSNPEVYIGNLDSDDYENAEYSLLIKKTDAGAVKLPLSIQYRNPNGKLYEKEDALKLRLYEGEELNLRRQKKNSHILIVIIVILLSGAGIYIYRKRKSKHAK